MRGLVGRILLVVDIGLGTDVGLILVIGLDTCVVFEGGLYVVLELWIGS